MEKLTRRRVMGIWPVRQKVTDLAVKKIGTLDLAGMMLPNLYTKSKIEVAQSSVQVYKPEIYSRMKCEQRYITQVLETTKKGCSEQTQQQVPQYLTAKIVDSSILRGTYLV